MNIEIDENQHPDSIWTWKSADRTKKTSLWIPYFQGLERLPKGKSDRYTITFNGGSVTFHLKQIDFLMFYGATGDLPIKFLDKLAFYKIPLLIHRRNMPRPYVFFPEPGPAEKDLLSQQILVRENMIRRCYVARTLIRERIRNMESVINVSATSYKKLSACRDLQQIRSIESTITQRYWNAYYQSLDISDLTRREKGHPVNAALDAGSFFLFGILLRWLLFHKFSPYHAYLHEPTSYPSLCYDLMEPYRVFIEQAVHEAYLEVGEEKLDRLTGVSLGKLKLALSKVVYVPASRQSIARKNLLHGVVLALRGYLLGEMRRIVIPVEGEKKGGRPPKLSYRIPGGR